MNKLELLIDYYFGNKNEFLFPEIFKNCIYPWNVFELLNDILSDITTSIEGDVSSNSSIVGNVIIGKNTVVEECVKIEGPVIIGENCNIRHGALIRPGTVIGDNCSVGHGSEIKNSIIFNQAKIASLVFVGDSIIGKSARVGSGIPCRTVAPARSPQRYP